MRFGGGGPAGVVVGEASAWWWVRATRMAALRSACDVPARVRAWTRVTTPAQSPGAPRALRTRPPNVQFPRLLVKSFRRFGLKKAPQLSAARPSRPIKALTLRDG